MPRSSIRPICWIRPGFSLACLEVVRVDPVYWTDPEPMKAIRTQSVPALDRALDLLELLAASKSGMTLSELVGRSRLPKSSVHCLLITMERRGFLHRNVKSGRYLFRLRLFSVANMAISGLSLREQAQPFLKELMTSARLTVHMAILEDNEAVVVSKCEPPGIYRLATWIGKRMDVHCTSLGKAMIAYLPSERLDRIFKEHGLPRHNENTLCSSRRLREDLARTVRLGYAIDDEEDELGLRCIGAPVFDHENNVVASISVSGNTDQVQPSTI